MQFSYDWPGLDLETIDGSGPAALCLHGAAPRLARVTVPPTGTPCANLARAADADSGYPMGLNIGRVYIPQTRSEELTRKLTDPDLRGFVMLRQREDGTVTPQELRFRPLTQAERQAREAERATPVL